MKRSIIIISSFFILSVSLSAQNGKFITVKPGTRIIDYFPTELRYRYPAFTDGQVIFKNSKISPYRLNYNFLSGEMEYIQTEDTMSITKNIDIRSIVLDVDTFYYNNGYLEQIKGGPVQVLLYQRWELYDVQRLDAYGLPIRGTAASSYDSFPTDSKFINLVHNENIIFRKVEDYFISFNIETLIPFKKKDILELFPQKASDIKGYLKSNKVDFESRDDLIRFADYLERL